MEYFPVAAPRALRRRDPVAPAAPGDRRHAARQPDGQPVGHLVRPSHDRGHRARRSSDVARAFLASREIFGFAELWREIDELGSSVELDAQLELFLDCAADGRTRRRVAAASSPPAARHRRRRRHVLAPGMAFLAESLDDVVSGRVARRRRSPYARRAARGRRAGRPRRSGRRRGRCCTPAFDIVEIAHTRGTQRRRCGRRVLGDCSMRSTSAWLWDGVGHLPRSDRWQTQARSALRDDLLTVLADLTRQVMRSARRVAGGVDRRQRAAVGRGAGDAHRDPPRRELRPDHAVGRAPPAAQPDDHGGRRRPAGS